MNRYRIMQQALDISGYGGVSVEYKALQCSKLKEEYEFIPLILNNFHSGINIKDIKFYYRKIKEKKPDIIQIRGASIDGLNAVIAAKLYGKAKILLCVHGMYSDLVYYGNIKKWIAKHVVEPLSFAMSDGISFVYKEAEKRQNFKRYRKKIVQYVYNRIPDYSLYDIEKERELFRVRNRIPQHTIVGIYCGRVSIEKGLSFLAEALMKLKDSEKEIFHLLIVGDGDYSEELKLNVKKNPGLNVHFMGSMMDVRPALAASDFFIMPSLHENHSIALLEAMAMKLPCVATRVGGNAEIIHNGKFGILIPPFDADALHEAISRLLSSEIRNEYKKKITEYNFHEFSDGEVDKQLEKAYTMLFKTKRDEVLENKL